MDRESKELLVELLDDIITSLEITTEDKDQLFKKLWKLKEKV